MANVYYTSPVYNYADTALAAAQNNSLNFAGTANQNMAQMAANAMEAFNSVELPNLAVPTPLIARFWSARTPPSTVTLSGISATAPAAPSLGAVTVPTFDAAPVFNMALPVINLPTAPSAVLPSAPGAAPGFVAPTLPDEPTFSLPAVPVFENLALPAAPTVNLPTFDTLLPIEDITAPSEVFSYAEQPYQDALLDQLKIKLMSDLVNGGYGIEPADEAGLWQRAMDREMRSAEAALFEANRAAAARGFMLPPGSLFAQMESARQDSMEKNSSVSREIALKRADMYVENRRFTITEVRETEQMLITYFGYSMERALNVAKATVELGLRVYDARLARLKYYMEREQVRAQVYDTQLKAALANLEAYKVQIEGTRLAADVQRIHAEVYRTQLQGIEALVNVYRTEVEAAKVTAEIEQLKLTAFKTAVEAYTAQVGAKTAEFGMYESQIKGEMAKEQVYRASVDSYSALVQGYTAKVDAAKAVLQAQIEPNKLFLEKYRADIAGYEAALRASQTQLQAQVSKYESDIRLFTATVAMDTEVGRLWVDSSKAQADVDMKVVAAQAEIALGRARITEAIAAAYGQINSSLAGSFGSLSSTAVSAASAFVAQVSTT